MKSETVKIIRDIHVYIKLALCQVYESFKKIRKL